MSRIKGKDTDPELLVRRRLYLQGIRYRLHVNLPGKPDIVVRKSNAAVFINGCFWHSHRNCRESRLPKSNVKFWRSKIKANVQRDRKNYQLLEEAGWRVMVVWQCELDKDREEILRGITTFVSKIAK